MAAAKSFVLVGSSSPGQTVVADSPVYGRVPQPEKEEKGILVLGGEGLELQTVGFFPLDAHVGWICQHPTNGKFYAAGGGKVHEIDLSEAGEVSYRSNADAIGGPAHLELSTDGAWALVANYSAGNLVVFPINPDGSVGAASDSKHHSLDALSHLADRQEASHPHQIVLDPAGSHWALSCDLGSDFVMVYAFDSVRGGLIGAANSHRHLKMPEGSGPRHLAFHPSGELVFVLCELDGYVRTCSWDSDKGLLVQLHATYTLPEGAAPCRAHHSGSAHVLVSADGQTLYVTSRGDGAVVVFKISGDEGKLTFLQRVASGGICPRNFLLDYSKPTPCLRVGNQDTQNLASFAIKETGELVEPPIVTTLPGVCPNMLLACSVPAT